MAFLLVVAVTFLLLWLLFIRPQQQRVRAHQALVDELEVGDEIVMTAGIYGRIVDLGPEDMRVEVDAGVSLRVARQAVLRRVEHALDAASDPSDDPPGPTGPTP